MYLDVVETTFLQLVYDALRTRTGVGEHQGGVMLVDELLEGVVHHRIDDVG